LPTFPPLAAAPGFARFAQGLLDLPGMGLVVDRDGINRVFFIASHAHLTRVTSLKTESTDFLRAADPSPHTHNTHSLHTLTHTISLNVHRALTQPTRVKPKLSALCIIISLHIHTLSHLHTPTAHTLLHTLTQCAWGLDTAH
jgi:hypothetical protein